MVSREHISDAFHAAMPIVLGYVAIGIPCGILCDSIGLNALQVFLLSALFYSGAGQFMIPNMYLAASPLASILASVSLVNTRQMLYSASFAPECQNVSKRLAFFFAATVTDESYGVSTAKFEEGDWSVDRALMVNLFSQTSWTVSNVVGVLVGGAINIPLNIAAFAMTSIFICLLVTQKMTSANIVAIVCAMAGVYGCKAVGLSGPAILVGALLGVAAALLYAAMRDRQQGRQGGSNPVRAGRGEMSEVDIARVDDTAVEEHASLSGSAQGFSAAIEASASSIVPADAEADADAEGEVRRS